MVGGFSRSGAELSAKSRLPLRTLRLADRAKIISGREALGWNATGIGAFLDRLHRYLGFLEEKDDSVIGRSMPPKNARCHAGLADKPAAAVDLHFGQRLSRRRRKTPRKQTRSFVRKIPPANFRGR